MSHFSTLVIVKSGDYNRSAYRGVIEGLLAPYNENLEVPEYYEPCSCRRWAVNSAAYEYADRVVATVEYIRELPDNSKEQNNFWQQRRETVQDRIAYDPRYGTDWANPECVDCNGTGQRATNYNPKSKWDWFCIADGRFSFPDGLHIKPIKELTTAVFSFDVWPDDDPWRFNAPIGTERRKWYPFAIVTPDGEWHEKGSMGWWAMVSDEKDDWQTIVDSIYEKYAEGYHGIICDLHI